MSVEGSLAVNLPKLWMKLLGSSVGDLLQSERFVVQWDGELLREYVTVDYKKII